MKKVLFLFALLTAYCSNVKAQSVLNLTNCDMRIRVVCLDGGCNPFSTGAWITVPALTTTPMTLPTCTTSGFNTAYEVTWGAGSNCNTAAKIKFPGCLPYVPNAVLPACCEQELVRIDWDPNNLIRIAH